MGVALIRPRLSDYLEEEFQEPLGAEAVCGYLRKNGVSCRVFDRRLNVTVAEIEEFQPDFVGFSLMTEEDLPDALRLTQLLKRPERRFFAGGLLVTTDSERVRSAFPSDVTLIAGEGEAEVLRLVSGEGTVTGALYVAPNEWALASRDDMPRYLAAGGVINMRTSRGCHGNCTFCTTPKLPAPFRKYEARDISLVVDEMELLAASYAPIFNFTDDEFGDGARLTALAGELNARGLKTAFSLELRAGVVMAASDEDWKRWHEAGLCRVFTGLESLCHETLAGWKKPVEIERLLDGIERAERAGVRVAAGYILWHRDTNPEQAFMEMEWLHGRCLFSPKAALSRLIVFPGTELYERDCEAGKLDRETERAYQRTKTLMEPWMELWKRAAMLLPGALCRAHLSEVRISADLGGSRQAAERLEKYLAELNEEAWAVLLSGEQDETALEKRKEICDAICGTGTGSIRA